MDASPCVYQISKSYLIRTDKIKKVCNILCPLRNDLFIIDIQSHLVRENVCSQTTVA